MVSFAFFLFSLVLAIGYENPGWLIAFALLDIGDAIRKKGKVE